MESNISYAFLKNPPSSSIVIAHAVSENDTPAYYSSFCLNKTLIKYELQNKISNKTR